MTRSLWILIHSLARGNFLEKHKAHFQWNQTKWTLSPRETGAVEKALIHVINLKYSNFPRTSEFSQGTWYPASQERKDKKEKRRKCRISLEIVHFILCGYVYFNFLFLGQHQMYFTQINTNLLTYRTGLGLAEIGQKELMNFVLDCIQ